jgi:hypothetical protein
MPLMIQTAMESTRGHIGGFFITYVSFIRKIISTPKLQTPRKKAACAQRKSDPPKSWNCKICQRIAYGEDCLSTTFS